MQLDLDGPPREAASPQTQSSIQAKPAGPCAIVIFGAGGDLTKRLVVPALYNLARTKLIPEHFALIGVDIADLSTDQWRQQLTEMMQRFTKGGGEFHADKIDPDAWNFLLSRMTYLRGDFGNDATFAKLSDLLQRRSAPMEPRAMSYSISRSPTVSSGPSRRKLPPRGWRTSRAASAGGA